MKDFDVWIYVEGADEFLWVDTYTGYLQDIISAVLTLYPNAVGIDIKPHVAE